MSRPGESAHPSGSARPKPPRKAPGAPAEELPKKQPGAAFLQQPDAAALSPGGSGQHCAPPGQAIPAEGTAPRPCTSPLSDAPLSGAAGLSGAAALPDAPLSGAAALGAAPHNGPTLLSGTPFSDDSFSDDPPLPDDPPPVRGADLDRARREAIVLLLRSRLTGLAVDPTSLATGRLVVFDTIAGYCARAGVPRTLLTGRLGALGDGCTLQLGALSLVLTDFHGAGDCRRRRFTQAHELGHILLGHTQDGPLQEREANRFAAELLMPCPLLAELERRHGRLRAREVADWFFVSVSAASAQLARLHRCGAVWDDDARALAARCEDWLCAALTDPPVTV